MVESNDQRSIRRGKKKTRNKKQDKRLERLSTNHSPYKKGLVEREDTSPCLFYARGMYMYVCSLADLR